jgi:hypothetical protein
VQSTLPNVTSLQLLDCPPGFLASAVTAEDLSAKLQVRTFLHEYHCATCQQTSVQLIDVAANLEYLIAGQLPAIACPTCKQPLQASPLDPQQLQRLPARANDPALDKFLQRARQEPLDKLEAIATNAKAAVATATAPAGSEARSSRAMYVAIGLGVLVVAGLVVVGVGVFRSGDKADAAVAAAAAAVAKKDKDPKDTTKEFTRPDWIVTSVPSSAFCRDLLDRLVCVGVSSYRATRDDGAVEASDAALDELAQTVALKISDPFFKTNVVPAFSDPRAKAIGALQVADTERDTPAFATNLKLVIDARKRVADLLRGTGGEAVPAQRSDWYWEEYAKVKGTGTEVLVFVRYDVSFDAVKTLVEKYGKPHAVGGATFATAFPSLAWSSPEFAGGLLVESAGKTGLTPGEVVTKVNGAAILDTSSLAKIAKPGSSLALELKDGETTKQLALAVK